jgi:hypothetical protein
VMTFSVVFAKSAIICNLENHDIRSTRQLGYEFIPKLGISVKKRHEEMSVNKLLLRLMVGIMPDKICKTMIFTWPWTPWQSMCYLDQRYSKKIEKFKDYCHFLL